MPPPNVGTVTLAKVGNSIHVSYPVAAGAVQYNIKHKWFDMAGSVVASDNFTTAGPTTSYTIIVPNNGNELIVNVVALDSTGTPSTSTSTANWKKSIGLIPLIWGGAKRVFPYLAIGALILGIIAAIPWIVNRSKGIGASVTNAANAVLGAVTGTNSSTSAAAQPAGVNSPTGPNKPNTANTAGTVANSAPANYNTYVYGDINGNPNINNGNQNANNTSAGNPETGPTYVPAKADAPDWTREVPAKTVSIPPANWNPDYDLPVQLEPNNRVLYVLDPLWFVEVFGDEVSKIPMQKASGKFRYNEHTGYVSASGQVGLSLGTDALYLQPRQPHTTVYLRFRTPNFVPTDNQEPPQRSAGVNQ